MNKRLREIYEGRQINPRWTGEKATHPEQLEAAAENQALKRIEFNYPPEPDWGTILQGSEGRVVNAGPESPITRLGRTIMRYSWQMAVGAVVLGVLIALLMWPRAVTWATVDGYVLEYKLVFDEEYTGTVEDGPDHPMVVFRRTVEEWAKEHADAVELPEGGELVEFKVTNLSKHHTEIGNNRYREDGFEARIQLRLMSAEETLSEGLIDTLTRIDGLTGPEVFSETWYYQEKHPQIYYPGRQVRINGKLYTYPQDFKPDELDDLWLFNYVVPNKVVAYLYNFKIGSGRIPLADVVLIHDDGKIHLIDDYSNDYLPDRTGIPSFIKSWSVYVGKDELELDFDPLELLTRGGRSEGRQFAPRDEIYHKGGLRLITDLPQTYVDMVVNGVDPGDDQEQAALKLAGRLDAALKRWLRQYPELNAGGELESLVEYKVVNLDGVPVQWCATIWFRHPDLSGEVIAELEKATDEPVRLEYVLQPEMPNRGFSYSRMAEEDNQWNWRILFKLIEEGLGSLDGKSYDQRMKETPAEVITEANRKADLIESVFTDWQQGQSEEDQCLMKCECFRGPDNYIAHAFIFSKHENREEFASLLDAFSKAGLPEPVVSPVYKNVIPQGMNIYMAFYEPEQFQGVTEDTLESTIDTLGREQKDKWIEQTEATIKEWMQQHKAGRAGSNADIQVECRRFPSSLDSAIGLIVSTNLPRGRVLDDLVEMLVDNGAPQPFLHAPFTYEAGDISPEDKAQIEALGLRRNSVLHKNLINHPLMSVFPNEIASLFSSEEHEAIKQEISLVENTIAKWNDGQVEVDGSVPKAELFIPRAYGMPTRLLIECTHCTEPVVLSLKEALETAGVKDILFGTYYLNRHVYEQVASRVEEYNTAIQITFLPHVVWEHATPQELDASLTDEERKQIKRMLNEVTSTVDTWLVENEDFQGESTSGLPNHISSTYPLEGTPSFYQISLRHASLDRLIEAVNDLKVQFEAIDGIVGISIMGDALIPNK